MFKLKAPETRLGAARACKLRSRTVLASLLVLGLSGTVLAEQFVNVVAPIFLDIH